MSTKGWIAVDLDGTLAHYTGRDGGSIGQPIMVMVERVKRWLAEGKDVRIFTARVAAQGEVNNVGGVDDLAFAGSQRQIIETWCEQHIGCRLPITATKDFQMIELWDDRCIQVRTNTGDIVGQTWYGIRTPEGGWVRFTNGKRAVWESQAEAEHARSRNWPDAYTVTESPLPPVGFALGA